MTIYVLYGEKYVKCLICYGYEKFKKIVILS